MSCETCRNREAEDIAGATKESRLMADMVQAYDRQNRRLWVAVLTLAGSLVITAGCMVWAVTNAQRIANEAMLNALNSVAEIGVTEETITTTTTQEIEGDSAIINNADFEQYNDNAVNGGGN